MNYTGPKVRLSRKLGVALTPKGQVAMEKRPGRPGQHGGMRRRRQETSYGKQLLEKQRLRFQYNVRERQMRTYFKRAMRREGPTGDNLVQLLESRLDALVYRAGLARTIYAARQFVNHGHIDVDGKRVDIPSFSVRIGQTVGVREKSRQLDCFRDGLGLESAPAYLRVADTELSFTKDREPERDEVPVICDVRQVVEFYSR